MFCGNCGNEIKENNSFCTACGTKVNNNETLNENQSDLEETVICEDLCNRVKSTFNVQNGHTILTTKRFIYSKHSFAKIAVMGLLVNLTKGDYDFDIPINEIKSFEDGRQGISKTIIINTKSGEKYNFYFTKRDEWLKAFNNVI